MKTKVLILTGRYLPGYKDGGPVRSIQNLVMWMGDRLDIRIMCLDRDHGDDKPYEGIRLNEYNDVSGAKVRYVESFTEADIRSLAGDADVVYCCGPYSDYARIVMKLKRDKAFAAPLYVAAMGSFSPEAFAIKGAKKKLFVKGMKLMGFFRPVTWSVTSKREEEELKAVIGRDSKCVTASDLPRKGRTDNKSVKSAGSLSLIFLSRISKKKNLILVPEILKKMPSDIHVSVDVYGVKEDEEYLNTCIEEFKKLPDNIAWEIKGEVRSEDVPETFSHYDAFIFPTLGENYGHVIAESLAAGCIPVISNNTPWLDFEKYRCGYVCDNADPEQYAKALIYLAGLDGEEMGKIRADCYDYIERVNGDSVKNSGYKKIFGIM